MKGSAGLIAATASMRFITVVLQSVAPLYIVLSGGPTREVSIIIAILWAGVTIGSLLASTVSWSDLALMVGLPMLSAGTALLAAEPRAALASVTIAGLGAGMLGSTLAPSLHLSSGSERPHEGIAGYGLGLSTGLVAATALAALANGLPGLRLLLAISAGVPVAAAVSAYLMRPRRVRVRLPTIAEAIEIAQRSPFLRPFTVNLFYSLTMPLVLSYWSIYATKYLGLSVGLAFALLTAHYVLSGLVRLVLYRARTESLRSITLEALAAFVAASLLFLTRGWWLMAVGLLMLAVPHALIYPISLYEALASSPGREVEASYIFSISAGGGEVLGSLVALGLVEALGLGRVYVALLPLSLLSLTAYLGLERVKIVPVSTWKGPHVR